MNITLIKEILEDEIARLETDIDNHRRFITETQPGSVASTTAEKIIKQYERNIADIRHAIREIDLQ